MANTGAPARRAVILTALPLEFAAVKEHLSDAVEVVHRGTVYERGRFISERDTWDVLIAQVGMGNEGAAFETERAITYFNPEVALFVGVAGSLKPEDAGLGAVVAATKVYRYESGKAADTFLPRSEVNKPAYALWQRALAVARSGEWVQRIKGPAPADTPNALTGAIAAGEKVIASHQSEVYRFVRERYSDAVAVEMEGSGFLSAAYANAAVDALLVRGISDLVAGKEDADRHGSQSVAARHAAAFAFEVLARFTRGEPGTESPCISNIPHPRNLNFTGREGLLDSIHTALTSGEVTALTQPQAIHGLGGIGKTQIAVEYAYRHESEYDIVWWLRAEEPAVLAADYAALARPLGLPSVENRDQSEIIETVRRALESRPRWLLVFDNAPDLASVHVHLPRGGTGHVLVTSRNATQWRDRAHAVPVERWEIEEATAFLARRTGQADEAAATELAEEVGRLPLALAQAAAYIDGSGITIADYLDLFRARRAQILARGQPLDYPDTVATTWDISFNRVREESPGAADLLNLCAFFAPDDIPRDLITGGAENLPEPLAATVADPVAFNDAIALTRRYSLLEVRDGSALSMHRLVQAVVRDRLGDAADMWAGAAARTLDRTMPRDTENSKSWAILARLLPHALMLGRHAREIQISADVIAGILSRAGTYFLSSAEFDQGLSLLLEALEYAEKVFGDSHFYCSAFANDVGIAYHDLGNLAKALEYHRRALQIDTDAPQSLECYKAIARDLNNLGSVYRDLGHPEDAKAFYERALVLQRHFRIGS